jgi:uncharacterized protein with LGFP repeats
MKTRALTTLDGSTIFNTDRSTGFRRPAPTNHGAIITRWAQLGFERSFLAYPTTDELATYDNARRVSYFQKGSIHWSPSGPGLGAAPKHLPDLWNCPRLIRRRVPPPYAPWLTRGDPGTAHES